MTDDEFSFARDSDRDRPPNPYAAPSFNEERRVFSEVDPRHGTWSHVLFSFEGRIPRRVYWGATIGITLFFYACVFAVALLAEAGDELSDGVFLVIGAFALAGYFLMLWTHLAVQVKRWHDRGKSGWMALIVFIPLIGPLWIFVECGFLRGDFGSNEYGPDPT